MRRLRIWAPALLALSTLLPSTSSAGPILQNEIEGPPILVVPFGVSELKIPSKIVGEQRADLMMQSSFGTMEERPSGLFFVPDAGFWDRGADTFMFTSSRAVPDFEQVYLLAEHPGLIEIMEDFEGSTLPGQPWNLRYPGFMSLSLQSGFPTQALALPFGQAGEPALSVHAKGGGGTTGTRITFGVDPDPYMDPDLLLDVIFPVSEALNPQGQPLWKLVMRATNEHGVDQLMVRGEALVASGAYALTPWASLPFGVSRLRFHWWPSSAPGASDGGMLLTEDSVPLARATGLNTPQDLASQISFGLLGPTVGLGGNLYLDDIVFVSEADPPDMTPLFLDGGEAGHLGLWSQFQPVTNVTTSPQAAFTGAYGFDFDLTEGQNANLRDESPRADRRLTAGFDLNVNQLHQPVGSSVVLFRMLDAGQPPPAMKLFLVSTMNGYFLHAYAREDNQTWRPLDPVPLGPRGWHHVKVQWWAATSDASENGGLRLWLDGDLAASELDLDNASYRIHDNDIGARGVDAATTGRIFMDNYSLRY